MVRLMALDLDEQDGQTPLDPDEKTGLIPEHLTTKAELNDWEQENILRAVRWLKRSRSPDVLSEGFCRDLHKQMLGQTWSWTQVGIKLAQLFGNTRWWIDNATFSADEIAARFHRDLVWIHPFPNGNGRHSRMMADALLRSLKQPAFTWGNGGNLVAANDMRARYLAALRAADQGDYQLLLAFVRS
jgi:Fic-DOC domain mobile mystery protein B